MGTTVLEFPALDKLRVMLAEVSVTDGHQPEQEVADEEMVVGEMTDELKRIYSLLELLDNRLRSAVANSITTRKPIENDPELMKEMLETRELADVLLKLQWFVVKTTFGFFGPGYESYTGVGFRKGWKVVFMQESLKPELHFPPQLQQLLGDLEGLG